MMMIIIIMWSEGCECELLPAAAVAAAANYE